MTGLMLPDALTARKRQQPVSGGEARLQRVLVVAACRCRVWDIRSSVEAGRYFRRPSKRREGEMKEM